MFILRAARPTDFKQIYSLSRMLNQINLSTESAELQKQIQKSAQAFSGELQNKFEADYIFCVENTETKKIVGTSMAMAQHGTKVSPSSKALRTNAFVFSIDPSLYCHAIMAPTAEMFDTTSAPTFF